MDNVNAVPVGEAPHRRKVSTTGFYRNQTQEVANTSRTMQKKSKSKATPKLKVGRKEERGARDEVVGTRRIQ